MTDKLPDFVSDLFKRESKQCPQIEFSVEFEARPAQDKIKYLKSLASSCNWAAAKIQDERDKLNKLLFDKEALVTQLHEKLEADRQMINKTLMRINGEKQKLTDENQSLYAEIKQLQKQLEELRGDNGR